MATFNMESTMPVMLELRVQAGIRPILKKLKGQTHFSKLEIQALLIIYYKLTKKNPMDRSRFKEVMDSIFEIHNEMLMDRIFSAFDLTNSLIITPESWVKGLSIYLRGTLDEKIKFCFQVYDMFGDGLITKEMMFHTMRNCLILKSQDEADESLRELIDLVIKKMDEDQDGYISFEDYKSAVEKNSGYLEVLGQCLPSTPTIYKFMATFTSHVSSTKPPKDLY